MTIDYIFCLHIQFLSQEEYLKGIKIYESIIKAYASYVDDSATDAVKDELWKNWKFSSHPSIGLLSLPWTQDIQKSLQ